MQHTSTLSHAAMTLALSVLIPVVGYGQQPSNSDDEPSRYELMVKYAKASMELAAVELDYALEENRKIPGIIQQIVIERLRSNLAVAEEQYNEATLASVGGPERVQLRHAEEKIRLAKLDVERGRKLHFRGVINDLELKRRELKYDVAKLNLTLLNNPGRFVSQLHYLEARVNRLSEEILSIDQRLSKLEPTHGSLPKN